LNIRLVLSLHPGAPSCLNDKNKKPAELCASAGLNLVVLANSAAHPRLRAMRVMAMMMVTSQHESLKLRDGARPVNSKDSMSIIGIRNGMLCAVSISGIFKPSHTQ
jgi:hypothetical protein